VPLLTDTVPQLTCILTNTFVTIVFMTPRPAPISRRDRPAKPPLSRAGLIAVALRIMREEGLEKATMRRLAAELDTGPASLYVYVENTAELHTALLDEILDGLPMPAGDDPARWRDDLIDLLGSYTQALAEHPTLARSVLLLRPSGPNYLRLIDALLGLLWLGGVPVRRAAWGVDLLLQQSTAAAAEHGTGPGAPDSTEQEDQQLTAVREVKSSEHPHIATARAELFSGTGRQRRRWALTALIDGIASTPTPKI